MRVRLACVFLAVAAACGRSGDFGTSGSSTGGDLAGAGADLAGARDQGGSCGPNGTCPPPLQCHDGMCCAGMICIPPGRDCGPNHPCPRGEQCIMHMCVPTPPDGGHRHDLGMIRDLGAPGDGGVRDGGVRDGGVRDGGVRDGGVGDGGVGDGGTPPGGCTNDNQCPGAKCDWLTGQCVPLQSCNQDRDCPTGAACVGHQCLPIQICLPIPILPPCLPGTHCQFPPGVCVPNPNCGTGRRCPTDERCVGGYCQPNACTSAADCNHGYDCVKGQCVPRRYCGPFEPCPRPLRCSAHVCVP